MFKNVIKYLPIVLCTIGVYQKIWTQNIELTAIDSLTKKPISNIHLYLNNNIVGFTNFNGIVEVVSDITISENKLLLSHIGYNDKELFYNNSFKKFDTILLSPKTYNLDEVLISYKRNNLKHKNNSFLAYFRGWQVENSNLKYFVDGICVYSLSNGVDIDRNILEYRFFKNDSLIKNRDKRMIEIEIGFVLPKLTSRNELERSLSMFNDDFIINKNKETDVIDFPLILFGSQRGKYSLDSLGRLSVYEYNQLRDSTYTAKKLGYRQKILNEHYLIKYKLFNGILFNSFEKKYSLKQIKHKKDDLFKDVETNFEILILDNYNLQEPKKRIKSFSENYSYYNNIYLNDIFGKYPLPKNIKGKLKNLDLMKNKYKLK